MKEAPQHTHVRSLVHLHVGGFLKREALAFENMCFLKNPWDKKRALHETALTAGPDVWGEERVGE